MLATNRYKTLDTLIIPHKFTIVKHPNYTKKPQSVCLKTLFIHQLI